MKILSIILAVMLSACSTILPSNSAQTVYIAKSDYAAALTIAVAYKRLPDCSTAPQPCSSAAIVKQLQKADDVAAGALDAAETAVRTPGFGSSIISTSLSSAKAAVNAFLSITNTLRSK